MENQPCYATGQSGFVHYWTPNRCSLEVFPSAHLKMLDEPRHGGACPLLSTARDRSPLPRCG